MYKQYTKNYKYSHAEIWLKYMSIYDAAYIMLFSHMQILDESKEALIEMYNQGDVPGKAYRSNYEPNLEIDVWADADDDNLYGIAYEAIAEILTKGKYHPATLYSDEEYPDVSIEDIEITDKKILVAINNQETELFQKDFEKAESEGNSSFSYLQFYELMCLTAEIIADIDSNVKYKTIPKKLPEKLEEKIKEVRSRPDVVKKTAMKRFGL